MYLVSLLSGARFLSGMLYFWRHQNNFLLINFHLIQRGWDSARSSESPGGRAQAALCCRRNRCACSPKRQAAAQPSRHTRALKITAQKLTCMVGLPSTLWKDLKCGVNGLSSLPVEEEVGFSAFILAKREGNVFLYPFQIWFMEVWNTVNAACFSSPTFRFLIYSPFALTPNVSKKHSQEGNFWRP